MNTVKGLAHHSTTDIAEEMSQSFNLPVRAYSNLKLQASPYTSYYDIPIGDGTPDYEMKVVEYLQSLNIHMSHPSMKKVMAMDKQRTTAFSRNIVKESNLMSRRKESATSRIFKVSLLSIDVPAIKHASTK